MRKYYRNLNEVFCKRSWMMILSKGKDLPRKDHEGPEGEYRYRSTLSLTLALDEGGLSAPRPGRFTPGKETR
jgi:hypothetical protein